MIVPCAGQCGTRLRLPTNDGRIYLCRRCWAALFSIVFDLIRRGPEVFTARTPEGPELS